MQEKDYWFGELHTANVKTCIRVERQLYSGTSDFQRIDVFDSPEFGRFLTSDGSVIFSEKDEFTYDEMIVHVPMAVHPDVQAGAWSSAAGDGGVARELSYYQEIEGHRRGGAGQDVRGRLPQVFPGQCLRSGRYPGAGLL